MSAKRTLIDGDEMLVNTSNGNLTHEESTVLFQEMEALEHKLYRKILSFGPFTSSLLNELMTFMKDHDSEKFSDFEADLSALCERAEEAEGPNKQLTADINAFCSRLVALDAPRYMARLALRLDSLTTAEEEFGFLVRGQWSDAAHATWLRQVKQLFHAAHEIKNRLVSSNQGLVGLIVKRYVNATCVAMSIADMQQEGSMGLYRAIDKFEWRRGFRFSTYATWWIRHHVTRALGDKAPLIRIPIHVDEKIRTVKRFIIAFQAKNGRNPTVDEIATETAIRKETVLFVVEGAIRTCSIDATMTNGKAASYEGDAGKSFHEREADPNTPLPSESIEKDEVRNILLKAVAKLSPREQEIVRSRFGFGIGYSSDEEKTLNEVGIKFDLSRERIRQLQTEVLGKLRHTISKEIPNYFN